MKIIGETLVNNVHFARSIVLEYHSIPKINLGSFWGRREEKWGSFRGLYSTSKQAIIAVLIKKHLLVFY